MLLESAAGAVIVSSLHLMGSKSTHKNNSFKCTDLTKADHKIGVFDHYWAELDSYILGQFNRNPFEEKYEATNLHKFTTGIKVYFEVYHPCKSPSANTSSNYIQCT